MKINFYILPIALLLFSCNILKNTSSKSTEIPFETIAELQNYTDNNCRFNGFKIGNYQKTDTYEKFGLDTLQEKYIWYTNDNRKVIINTFLKEKFAVKYAYLQIKKEFPELKGDITLTIPSKEIEKQLFAAFKKQFVKYTVLIAFNDELGYSSEVEVSKCDSNRAIAILENYPTIVVKYTD